MPGRETEHAENTLRLLGPLRVGWSALVVQLLNRFRWPVDLCSVRGNRHRCAIVSGLSKRRMSEGTNWL